MQSVQIDNHEYLVSCDFGVKESYSVEFLGCWEFAEAEAEQYGKDNPGVTLKCLGVRRILPNGDRDDRNTR